MYHGFSSGLETVQNNEFNKVRAVRKLRQVDAPMTALIYMEMEMVTNQFLSFE